jgi:acetyltransferase-like isoleucine patch superfamily enzyme
MKYYVKLLKNIGCNLKGTPRFIAASVKFDDYNMTTIGDRVVISSNVILLTHDYSYTTGLIALGEMPQTDVGIIRGINIGNNVFIGMNSILLPGVIVEDNVIIGAGSVVRGKITAYSIVSGNPAIVVGNIIDRTKKLQSSSNVNFHVDSK